MSASEKNPETEKPNVRLLPEAALARDVAFVLEQIRERDRAAKR